MKVEFICCLWQVEEGRVRFRFGVVVLSPLSFLPDSILHGEKNVVKLMEKLKKLIDLLMMI